MTFHLRNDWTAPSGDSYIDVISFSVKGSKVTTMSTKANSKGEILLGGPRHWNAFSTMSLEQGRKLYKGCLKRGYKRVEQAPELTYSRR